MQFQDESKREWVKLELEAAKIEASNVLAKAQAQLALAKAEEAEDGTQLEFYQKQLDGIAAGEQAIQAKVDSAMQKGKPSAQS